MCHHCVNRREFLQASIGATAGTAAVPMFLRSALAQTGTGSPGDMRTYTDVRTAFLYSYDARWPQPNMDPQPDVDIINHQLDGLEKEWKTGTRSWDWDIRFTGRKLLTSLDDVQRFTRSLDGADGVVVFGMSTKIPAMLNAVIDADVPTVFFSYPPTGHNWLQALTAVQQQKRIDLVASSAYSDLEPYAKIFDMRRRLQQAKVLCITPHNDFAQNRQEFIDGIQQAYGVTVQLTEYDRINEVFESIPIRDAERKAEDFIQNAVNTIEPSHRDIVHCIRMYMAAKKLLEMENADTITVNCFYGLLNDKLVAHPCVAWSLLNDEGYTGICEADMHSTMTSLMMKYYTGGKPGFVTDPYFDTHQNLVWHAHCVSATKMDGLAGDPEPYIIRSHLETDAGVAMQVKMRQDQTLTSLKLVDPNTMVVNTQQIVENSDLNRGCRTKFACRLIDSKTGSERDVEQYMYNYKHGLHRVLYYGNYAQDIEKMGRLLGINVVEEA